MRAALGDSVQVMNWKGILRAKREVTRVHRVHFILAMLAAE